MVTILLCHMLAFLIGYLLDLLIGDPYWLPHPIRLIGSWISHFEKRDLGDKHATPNDELATPKDELADSEIEVGKGKSDGTKNGKESVTSPVHKRVKGRRMVICVLLLTLFSALFLLVLGYYIHPACGVFVESIMTAQILAGKCLRVESEKVMRKLQTGTLEEARYAVSMIVGRDTQQLTAEQVAKAAVETVAENTSDGVIAPMLYLAIGGPVLGFLYKAINTMDSMVGYKSDRYLDYGRTAAKLDDVVNFLPARISAILMIWSCSFLGKAYDGKKAAEIFKRDRFNHASPNSAQTESVCAGALHLQLAGDASYFGKIVKKPFIGDFDRTVEPEDIQRAGNLLSVTAFLCEILCLLLLMGVTYAWWRCLS